MVLKDIDFQVLVAMRYVTISIFGASDRANPCKFDFERSP